MRICKDQGFPHPRTSFLSVENMHEAVSFVGFPALIKPNISSRTRGIVIVHDVLELQEKFPTLEREFGRCTLQ